MGIDTVGSEVLAERNKDFFKEVIVFKTNITITILTINLLNVNPIKAFKRVSLVTNLS